MIKKMQLGHLRWKYMLLSAIWSAGVLLKLSPISGQRFIGQKTPAIQVISYWVKNFREKGSLRDLRAKIPGRENHSGRKTIIAKVKIDAFMVRIFFNTMLKQQQSILRRSSCLLLNSKLGFRRNGIATGFSMIATTCKRQERPYIGWNKLLKKKK